MTSLADAIAYLSASVSVLNVDMTSGIRHSIGYARNSIRWSLKLLPIILPIGLIFPRRLSYHLSSNGLLRIIV